MPERRTLIVSCNQRTVGQLTEEGAVWRFDYAADWCGSTKSFDLAPALPRTAGSIIDGASQRPVQWFFDNLLPEEGVRHLVAREASLDSADAFGLLAYYGAESAGALVLLPPEQEPTPSGLVPLTEQELSQRIRNLPHVSLAAASPKRMSLAGAQHKIAVVLHDGKLWWPLGSAPSSHILKPDHSDKDNYPHTVANEWFCARLAQRLGIAVPPVQIRYVPEPVYLIERFDREGRWPDLVRLHAIDACQLLNLDRAYKYREATVESLGKIVGWVRGRAAARQRIFRWVVLNLLIGNHDAHLKNLSFFQTADGTELAPFYDLVSTAVYRPAGNWGSDQLAWPLGNARFLDDVRAADVLAMGERIGLPTKVATSLLHALLANVESAADAVLGEFDALAVPEPAKLTHEAEARLLRTIRYGVIPDVRRQLRA